MTLQFILLIIGFAMLIKGADWLVDGGSALAKKFNVSDLAIGLTIVAFGTSMPELVVNAFASYNQHSDIVYGNIIGSNIFNLLAILGIAGLITPLVVQSSTVWKEIPLSFGAIILLYLLANPVFTNEADLSRVDAVILLIMFGLFLFYVYTQLRIEAPATGDNYKAMPLWKIWFFILIGLVFLVWGGKLVVDNAVEIATAMGISETIIGLTIVAAGTSLPELATSIVAAFKKNNDIAIGNIIGSNIFNIFFILGVSSMIRPIPYNVNFNSDLGLLAVGTILLFTSMFVGRTRKLDRWEAGILFAMYIGYTVYLVNTIA